MPHLIRPNWLPWPFASWLPWPFASREWDSQRPEEKWWLGIGKIFRKVLIHSQPHASMFVTSQACTRVAAARCPYGAITSQMRIILGSAEPPTPSSSHRSLYCAADLLCSPQVYQESQLLGGDLIYKSGYWNGQRVKLNIGSVDCPWWGVCTIWFWHVFTTLTLSQGQCSSLMRSNIKINKISLSEHGHR